MSLKERRIAFIGGGHITGILVSRLTEAADVIPHRLIASDPIRKKLKKLRDAYGISIAADNRQAVDSAEFVFINVLPNVVKEVIEEFKTRGFPREKVIVTLAAGIPMAAFSAIGDRLPVVRALPNPASRIGKGVVALTFNPHVSGDRRKDIIKLFACFGDPVIVREDLVNAVMALSSPAITYLLFQSLIDAGIRAGIDHETAAGIVSRTIAGSIEIWQQRRVAPQELLTEAGTPGGISMESLYTLEKYAFRAGLMDAIASAIKRAEDLGQPVE
jgi:pyrroline-5-carboxylate reductase